MQQFNKYFALPELLRQIAVWRLKNDSIVFTNGCFDILHPGHIDYLSKAKAKGDRLIIGLNTDASVRRQNKASNRPINNEQTRITMLAALHCVDAIVLFEEPTPLSLISQIVPEYLVKGGDYSPTQIDENAKDYLVGSKQVKAAGGEVITIPLLAGFSTTSFIDKILKG